VLIADYNAAIHSVMSTVESLMAICGHDWSRLKPSKSKSQSNSIDSENVNQLRALHMTVATPGFTAGITQKQVIRSNGRIDFETDFDLDISHDSFSPCLALRLIRQFSVDASLGILWR